MRERGEPSPGIEPLDRLVTPVMEHAPYRSAERGFWVVDNGASPRGQAAVQRVLQAYPQALLVHTPLQASGLNQGEIYFSLGPRTVLPPNVFASWTEGEPRLRLDEDLWNPRLRPCQGNVTREKLLQFLDRLEARPMAQRQALTTPETSRQVA